MVIAEEGCLIALVPILDRIFAGTSTLDDLVSLRRVFSTRRRHADGLAHVDPIFPILIRVLGNQIQSTCLLRALVLLVHPLDFNSLTLF